MGNRSNIEQLAVRERLRFIERCAYWRGMVNRQDLARIFGLSMAQASADLQQYQQENPGVLVYNLNRKRYEGTEGMMMKFCTPVLEEAMALFLNGGVGLNVLPGGHGVAEPGKPVQVYCVRMPLRRATEAVERRVFLAVIHRGRVRVRYLSVNSGSADWRWLRPRAFAHDGNRWHIRAWDEGKCDWRDFNLSRIAEADWPEQAGPPAPPPDPAESWEEVLRLRPHSDLDAGSRAAVELDYSMSDGTLELPVNATVANYLRARLGLPLADGTLPRALLESAE